MNLNRIIIAYIIFLILCGFALCEHIGRVSQRSETVKLPDTVKAEIVDLSDENCVNDKTPVETVERGAEARKMVSLGTFRITHYTNSVECCGKTDGITRSGTVAKSNHTIAVDPDVIPLGSEVMIGGVIYTAEDTGSAVKGKVIDVYVDSLDANRAVPGEYAEVFLIK